MRIRSLLPTLFPLALSLCASALGHDRAFWAEQAARNTDGIIQLTTSSYDELLGTADGPRDYSVTVVLTAMGPQFKCTPCHEFDPSYRAVADSWRRNAPKDVRDTHFFASLDFADGQAVFQRLGLTTAPTVFFHPVGEGEVGKYDLNRHGLSLGSLHNWIKSTTPVDFNMYVPFNPAPLIGAVLTIAFVAVIGYTARSVFVPILQSRVVWGMMSIVLVLTFTSGFMWNKIKNAPYVAGSPDGKVTWIAGGYSNQLGLESQVVGALYGVLGLCIVILTVLIPAQSSPVKQRVGVYLWLGMLIVLFSLLIRLFRMKNGGYPFHLL